MLFSIWTCAVDDNTFLDANGVLGYVDGAQVDLGTDRLSMVQTLSRRTHIPHTSRDLETEMMIHSSFSGVLGYVNGSQVDLGSS